MTLTKAELADQLFEKVGLNKREAKDMVEAFFEEVPKLDPNLSKAEGTASHIRGCREAKKQREVTFR